MRISDWSSDVCSSDLAVRGLVEQADRRVAMRRGGLVIDRGAGADRSGERLAEFAEMMKADLVNDREAVDLGKWHARVVGCEFQRRDHQLERIESVIGVLGAVVELADPDDDGNALGIGHQRAFHSGFRSEEHTSELQSLMRISYAVFCLKKKK